MNTKQYTITNGKVSFSALDYGCIITGLNVPGKDNAGDKKLRNIVFSLEKEEDYIKNPKYYGAIVGRVANRIQNAEFSLDGKNYALDKNEGNNCLHSGLTSYSDMIYTTREFSEPGKSGIIFERTSPDMEQGFPGNLNLKVTYTLEDEKKCSPCDYPAGVQTNAFSFRPKFYSKFSITVSAQSDKKTPMNIINHSYFNLMGLEKQNEREVQTQRNPSIGPQLIRLNSTKFLETDNENLPTGKILNCESCSKDLSKIISFSDALKTNGNIFDNCFILDDDSDKMKQAALIISNESEIAMEVFTNQKAIQLYTPERGRERNEIYSDCFALETQGYVDALHHENFPSIIIDPLNGDVNTFTSKTEFILFYS